MPYLDLRDFSPPDSLNRIVVVGSSGSGKSTMARELSRVLQAPHVELDAIRHGPHWTETPDKEFCSKIAVATQGERWVVDGNYRKK